MVVAVLVVVTCLSSAVQVAVRGLLEQEMELVVLDYHLLTLVHLFFMLVAEVQPITTEQLVLAEVAAGVKAAHQQLLAQLTPEVAVVLYQTVHLILVRVALELLLFVMRGRNVVLAAQSHLRAATLSTLLLRLGVTQHESLCLCTRYC
jgi:hypothetical protein